jgi:hypothetical protein
MGTLQNTALLDRVRRAAADTDGQVEKPRRQIRIEERSTKLTANELTTVWGPKKRKRHASACPSTLDTKGKGPSPLWDILPWRAKIPCLTPVAATYVFVAHTVGEAHENLQA